MKENKLSLKDAKAKKRCDDEIQLHHKIGELLQEFSLKYDVICSNICIRKNEFYGTDATTPLYLIDTDWRFIYLY